MFRHAYANASGLIYRVKHIYFDTTSRTLPFALMHRPHSKYRPAQTL